MIDETICVGAVVVVNAVGSPLIPGTDVFWAFPFEQGDEFGGKRLIGPLPEIALDLPKDGKGRAAAGQNTTICIVATDADLSPELKRRIMATDGLARALRPVPSFYGYVVRVDDREQTGGRRSPARNSRASETLAADCVSRAVARVYAAATLGDVKSYRDQSRRPETTTIAGVVLCESKAAGYRGARSRQASKPSASSAL